MSDVGPLERPRTAGELFEAPFRLLGARWRTYVLLALAVVVPVDLVVLGFGAGQLTNGYDASPPVAATLLSVVVPTFVTTPLVTAMAIPVLRGSAEGRPVAARAALQAGLDAYPRVLGAVLVYVAAVVLGLALLVVPGIYVLVKGFLVTPIAVVEGAGGADALRRSWSLTDGRWWRTLALIVVVNLGATLLGAVVTIPAAALARDADAQVVSLAAAMATQLVTVPLVALGTTLLLFDLRARDRPV